MVLLTPLNSFAVHNFDVTVCSSGCDYTAFSTAENALDLLGGANIGSATTIRCGNWDAQSGTIADATAVTWDAGASTGTIHHMTDAGSTGEYMITVAVGTLDDDDIVSDGTNTITLNGASDTCSVNINCGANEVISDTFGLGGWTTATANFVTVSVLEPYRHNGTAATGCTITSANASDIIRNDINNGRVEWLVVKETWNNGTNSLECMQGIVPSNTQNTGFANNIIADCVNPGAGAGAAAMIFNSPAGTSNYYAVNNIIYGGEADCIEWGVTIGITGTSENNTTYGCVGRGQLQSTANGTFNARNNLSCANTAGDYNGNMDANTTNGSCDGLASTQDMGDGASLFVNTTNDFHLIENSGAIDKGTDLTTNTRLGQFDIDGRDRDAQGDTWDMGADESYNYKFILDGGVYDGGIYR